MASTLAMLPSEFMLLSKTTVSSPAWEFWFLIIATTPGFFHNLAGTHLLEDPYFPPTALQERPHSAKQPSKVRSVPRADKEFRRHALTRLPLIFPSRSFESHSMRPLTHCSADYPTRTTVQSTCQGPRSPPAWADERGGGGMMFQSYRQVDGSVLTIGR